jgi:hypothetical protein
MAHRGRAGALLHREPPHPHPRHRPSRGFAGRGTHGRRRGNDRTYGTRWSRGARQRRTGVLLRLNAQCPMLKARGLESRKGESSAHRPPSGGTSVMTSVGFTLGHTGLGGGIRVALPRAARTSARRLRFRNQPQKAATHPPTPGLAAHHSPSRKEAPLNEE